MGDSVAGDGSGVDRGWRNGRDGWRERWSRCDSNVGGSAGFPGTCGGKMPGFLAEEATFFLDAALLFLRGEFGDASGNGKR